mmetsp:Transcript_95802/g.213070  ORF Transcript_95802/g.213070 Transcript_95802/m.213070 type:complete len:239 (-) Transcript_95802:219-935(-)
MGSLDVALSMSTGAGCAQASPSERPVRMDAAFPRPAALAGEELLVALGAAAPEATESANRPMDEGLAGAGAVAGAPAVPLLGEAGRVRELGGAESGAGPPSQALFVRRLALRLSAMSQVPPASSASVPSAFVEVEELTISVGARGRPELPLQASVAFTRSAAWRLTGGALATSARSVRTSSRPHPRAAAPGGDPGAAALGFLTCCGSGSSALPVPGTSTLLLLGSDATSSTCDADAGT